VSRGDASEAAFVRRDVMETASEARYSGDMDRIDDARAFLLARELIAEHGDDVARFLQDKIDALMASGELEELSAWFVIRNAVALSLEAGPTLQ
jgi:hypothetical protein